MMKYLTISLVVAGLLLGPGYLTCTQVFSGKSIVTHTVFEQDVAHAGTRRSSVTATVNGNWSEPVPVELSPEMNPVRVKFAARHAPGATTLKKNRYRAILKHESGEVWKREFKLTTKARDKDTISIGATQTTKGEIHTFEVNDAGTYELAIKPKGHPEIAVAHLSVTVRRNVVIPNKAIAGVGFLILIFGVVLIFVRK